MSVLHVLDAVFVLLMCCLLPLVVGLPVGVCCCYFVLGVCQLDECTVALCLMMVLVHVCYFVVFLYLCVGLLFMLTAYFGFSVAFRIHACLIACFLGLVVGCCFVLFVCFCLFAV